MAKGTAYTSTVNPLPTVYALAEAGLEVSQRKWLRRRRGFIRYGDITPEYTVTHTDDDRHQMGLLIIVAIVMTGVLAVAGKVYHWSWIDQAGPIHWYTFGCVGALGVMVATWLMLRHRGPEIRYRFGGRHPFVIGGAPETKDDLDIFVNLLQQRIWAG